MPRRIEDKFFDLAYGVSSISITTDVTIVATTGGVYHGLSLVAGTTQCTLKIYDNSSIATGNLVDLVVLPGAQSVNQEKQKPVVAKNGMVVTLSDTGAEGVIFLSPQG